MSYTNIASLISLEIDTFAFSLFDCPRLVLRVITHIFPHTPRERMERLVRMAKWARRGQRSELLCTIGIRIYTPGFTDKA